LQFVGASRPKQIAVAAPRVDVSAAEVAEVMRIPLTHQLTYQMPGGSRFPSWGIWAAALLFVLLSAGFALPRNVVEGITRKVSEEIKAARNLAGGGESSNSEASLEAKKNGRELSNVTAIHTYDTENGSQVVVLLDGAVQYESARLGSPDRIYFDLHNTRLSSAAGQKANAAEGGLPNWVRAAQNNDDVVRLVLDADGPKNFSAKLLSDPYRLIIDIQGQSHNGVKEELNSSSTPQETVKPEPGLNSLPSGQPSLARELGLKIHRIVIDPGHGGNDTGTMGTHGLLEKNLCLDVALRLGELIEEKIPDAQVIYTRKDDRNIALEERTAMANEANADLFISIHANSSDSRQTRGVETYYVSLATSPESKNLATRENALAESSLHNLPELLKKITRNEKLAESKQLAEYLQNALAERLQLVSPLETNRGVKQAPFIVLIGANMPAVLSEISFVSNTSDENLLLESGQRQRVAEGLYRGIAAYLDSLQSPASSNLKLVRESHSSSTAVGLR
jgi:N-acetylmuramoyl-L-alanine amidase